jgi:CRISPR system Cascade subunit CasC
MDHRFLQLHILTSYPPANLNRDDLGRPKTAIMGGAMRLRVSSQSLKRAWRSSDVFDSALAGHKGVRTKELGVNIANRLTAQGVVEKDARSWARLVAKEFGKLKQAKDDGKDNALHIEQLAHFSPDELAGIDALVDRIAAEQREPEGDELKLLGKAHGAADIALFGRMLASAPNYNVEAAAQVAHALGVHASAVEDDFFTAVDDLNSGEEDVGAGHMGETEFGAGVFYLYVCVDRRQLEENLGRDGELLRKTLGALLECSATVAPTGKQNSFASRAYASYILAEVGQRQPRSLSVAFLKPVTARGEGMLNNAIEALDDTVAKMDKVYGQCAAHRAVMNATVGSGSLAELVEFCAGH